MNVSLPPFYGRDCHTHAPRSGSRPTAPARIGYRVRMTVASKTTARTDANARPGAAAPPDTAPPGTAARDEPRTAQPRQLIVTVYGLYGRAEGGWMSVASLVSLLADLGVDEPAVRSSISRLKRREILRASRRAGAAGYELSQTAQAITGSSAGSGPDSPTGGCWRCSRCPRQSGTSGTCCGPSCPASGSAPPRP